MVIVCGKSKTPDFPPRATGKRGERRLKTGERTGNDKSKRDEPECEKRPGFMFLGKVTVTGPGHLHAGNFDLSQAFRGYVGDGPVLPFFSLVVLVSFFGTSRSSFSL